MNAIAKESLLFDYYGSLLTPKKQRVMRLYHEENCSLSEIAEETGVSRTAVYDSLKNAEARLADYESKLGLVARFEETRHLAQEIRKAASSLREEERDPEKIRKLEQILDIVDRLDME